MRHRDSRIRLTQKPAHARMMTRNLVTSLLLYESVRTTKQRAKAMQPVVDRLIRTAKTRPAHVAIRSINRTVTDKNASRKIMEVYRVRYQDRSSGLTRAVPAGVRKGDGAELVDVSFVEGKEVRQETVPKAEKSKPKAATNQQEGKKKTPAKTKTP